MLALYLDHKATDGGGYNSSVQLAADVIAVAGAENVIVITNKHENVNKLIELGWNYTLIKYNYFARLFDITISKLEKILLYPRIIKFLPHCMFESILLKYKVNHIIFLSPSRNGLFLRNINYSFSMWDLAHRGKFRFPEFYKDGEWRYREQLYKDSLSKAHTIFVESKTTKDNILSLYNVLPHQILINKFTPVVQKKYQSDLNEFGDFLFYPAQYWEHKDHECLINALEILSKDYNIYVNLVCCGFDKGHLTYLKNLVSNTGLKNSVTFLDFVDEIRLQTLYKNCRLCVFPSKLGPTNLPPLEALLHGKRTVVSDVNEKIEGVGEGEILYFSTGDEFDLAKKLSIFLLDKTKACGKKFEKIIEQRAQKNKAQLEKWINTV